ncbi:MAG: thermonuclease family protein [Acidimicrobiia bacterium]
MARSRAAVLVVLVTAALLGGSHVPLASRGRTTWTVSEVVDGDTVVLTRGSRAETVRLLGVDTPETKHPDRPVGCYGPEAADFTEVQLLGRQVAVERDVEARDVYGRMLAYLELDGRRFNDVLLREGYATLLVIPPNDRHGREMLRAELDARSAGRGLWGVCSGSVD